LSSGHNVLVIVGYICPREEYGANYCKFARVAVAKISEYPSVMFEGVGEDLSIVE
jgi:hypothetical protein